MMAEVGIETGEDIADDAPHVLVVDDDRRIRELLKKYLTDHGNRVTTASDAAEARLHLNGLAFDLIVLDVMMPGESGLELAASLRRASAVPILMLTARAEPDDRIHGLEIGVDDYLAKPFEPKELLLRMANILKRSVAAPAPSEISIGQSVFLLEKGELRRAGEIIKLTSRERDLLRQLARAPGRTFAREELAQSGEVGTRAVDVQVNRLRRKLEPDPRNPVHLLTIRGAGYALCCD